ncbi:hypothetical protein HID58_094902 [Brassica napus]|uniref:Tryptophan synthase beta chain-like PALP domain-containing protein n=1 Tax=Brassica napus TaxID=3708 RepID=A0ABQ7X5W5_BRANA|nr:hypothetical protein HID58_094902 [Brassica napus]
MSSREEVASRVLHETGSVLIHPYNDGRIISGGGLISGVALAAKSIKPSIRIIAAEPKGADDAAQSKVAGRIITLPVTNTVADGLRASLGDLTWPVVRDMVDGVVVVEDGEIIEAMRMCYEMLKVSVKPSGAIGLAAVFIN